MENCRDNAGLTGDMFIDLRQTLTPLLPPPPFTSERKSLSHCRVYISIVLVIVLRGNICTVQSKLIEFIFIYLFCSTNISF